MGQNQSLCSSFHWKVKLGQGKVDRFQHLNVSFPQKLICLEAGRGVWTSGFLFIHLSHVKSWWKGQPKSLKCVDKYCQDILLSKNHHYSSHWQYTSPPFYRLDIKLKMFNWPSKVNQEMSAELSTLACVGTMLANGFPMWRLSSSELYTRH